MKLHQFLSLHHNQIPIDDQRLGQRFYNMFLRGRNGFSDRGLFNERDEQRALDLIVAWLFENHYFNGDLPQVME